MNHTSPAEQAFSALIHIELNKTHFQCSDLWFKRSFSRKARIRFNDNKKALTVDTIKPSDFVTDDEMLVLIRQCRLWNTSQCGKIATHKAKITTADDKLLERTQHAKSPTGVYTPPKQH